MSVLERCYLVAYTLGPRERNEAFLSPSISFISSSSSSLLTAPPSPLLLLLLLLPLLCRRRPRRRSLGSSRRFPFSTDHDVRHSMRRSKHLRAPVHRAVPTNANEEENAVARRVCANENFTG